jgi:hypothetical protein
LLLLGESCENPVLLYLLIFIPLVITITCFTILIIIISIFIIVLLYYKQKQRKYILKNKELTEKLFMMNDLQKIQFSSITLDKNKNGSTKIIGKGASSVVYSGIYKNNKVAIKEVNIGNNFEDSLLTEILLLKNLQHENIIRYFGYSIDYIGNFYVITEFCSNGPLVIFKKINSLYKKNLILFSIFVMELIICIYYQHRLCTEI